MWTSTYSKVIKSVKKEAVWQRWTDVNHWHEWIPNVESCQLEKPFVSGSSFILKPKGSPSMTVELLNVKRDHSFTGCTRFFGATMYDIHEMHQDPQGIRLTVTLKVTGPLGFLWRKLVAEKIEANLPILLRNLASVLGAPDLRNPVLSDKENTAISPKPKLHVIGSGSQKQKQKSKPKKSKIKVSVSSLKKTNPLLKSIPNESEISNRKVAQTMSTQTKPKLVTSTSKPKTKSSTVKKTKPTAKKSTVKKVAVKKSTTATKTVKAKATASSAKKKTVKAKLKLVTAKKTAPKKKSSLTKTTKAKSSASTIKKKTAKPAKSKSLTATKTSTSSKPKPKAKAKSKAKGK
jgi:hypothetical protein